VTHYHKELQQIVTHYRLAGGSWPASAREIAEWAIRTSRWKLPPSAAVSVCAEDLASAMREEYITDSKGRRVRVKHPVRLRRSGEQTVLWDDIRTATRGHMEVAFAQRRNQIVGDCRQLRLDIDSYNDGHPDSPPIQLILDFTKDIEEALHLHAA
jgi:hypothetical protein